MHLAHAHREQQIDLLGLGGDSGRKRSRIDAERVTRREEHVVEAVAVGGLHDVAAVCPRAGERRVGLAKELVVVVTQGAEPRNFRDVRVADGTHGSGTPSEA